MNKCLINNNSMHEILNFGMHPYADTFIKKDQLNLAEPIFPLICLLDEESGLVQLKNISNDYERYNLYEYSYTSSNSNFAKSHWIDYAKTIKYKFGENNFIIEIGSNDGYLINQFKDNNKILGIDASQEIVNLANENKIPSIHAIFDKNLANSIKSEYGLADIIIANNVFNHSNDPVSFAIGVANILKVNGVFVFELPYWFETVKSGKFDQIYHEHITYFSAKSAYHLLKKVGLEIFDLEIVDYHGGSLRVYARKSNNVMLLNKTNLYIQKEIEFGLFNPDFYSQWFENILNNRSKFLLDLYKTKIDNPNIPIIGVGAAAKANTLINFYKLDSSIINFITDSSVLKQNKYTPLSRIPIVGDDIFAKFDQAYALILSWNLSENLKNNLSKINKNIKYINL